MTAFYASNIKRLSFPYSLQDFVMLHMNAHSDFAPFLAEDTKLVFLW